MKYLGAEIVLKSLIEEQVDTIFGYPGGANMPLYDALFDYSKKLKHILVRHEQAAAHAAEGYARATGKTGVCFATSGPGATNLVTGIADAMMDSIPLVCITGQVAAHLIGSNAFQEVDIINITKPITKWNIQVTEVKHIAEAIHSAFHHAQTGRPGPVLVDIAKSAQLEMGEYSPWLPSTKQSASQDIRGAIVSQAAQLLNNAQKPLIIAGHGVLMSKAWNELASLAERIHAPVACTLLGLSAIKNSHPLFVGMVGMHGHYAPNMLTNEADVILAVGMRFDDRVTSTIFSYAPNAKIIHVDVDPKEFNKNIKVIPLHADAKQALHALFPHLTPTKHEEWLKQFADMKKIEQTTIINKQIKPEAGKILMAEAVYELSRLTHGTATIVADVGQNQMCAARYYQFELYDHFYTSGGLGTMGFALPAALGAQIGNPKKQVVAIVGDGGFQMNIQELGTIAEESIPVKVIILNNGFLGMVRQWQDIFFEKRYSFTTMHNPDFIAVGKAYGIEGKKVTHREDLQQSIVDMLSFTGPYLLEIEVEKETNVFPMIAPGASVSQVRLS